MNTCAKCDCTVLVRDGEEWEDGIDICDRCAQEQAYINYRNNTKNE